MSLVDAYYEIICHHRRWYESFESTNNLAALRDRWEKSLIHQPESAICEAMVREELEKHVDVVFPNEGVSHGGPDFQCFVKLPTGQATFFVEVTCITIDAATKETCLSNNIGGPPTSFGLLTSRFKDECRNKAKQLADLSAPGLLAISTLHSAAGSLCFRENAAECVLTSETLITQKIDTTTGDPVGSMFLTTKMDKSPFQRPGKVDPWVLEDALRSISGLLLCPYPSAESSCMRGVLHPNPARPFDHNILPKVPFTSIRWG